MNHYQSSYKKRLSRLSWRRRI